MGLLALADTRKTTSTRHYDAVVIGGGINGAGIARDLAGRGLNVLLCEKGDLASATSSASSKLIHGGLRYLEHYEFKLVRESLKEREVLLRAAPHIIWPLEFVLPHHPALRPRWMIRLGLLMYDLLGGRKSLPFSSGRQLTNSPYGQPLKKNFEHGFTYSDCWVEDTRLTVLTAVDAAQRGAEVLTRTACTALKPRGAKGWIVTLHDTITDESGQVTASMIVNAAGPWVTQALDMVGPDAGQYRTRLVKGSHIIVPRLYQGDHAYILQNDDKRIVFVMPYEKKFSLIGTTDVEYTGELDEVRITLPEVEYLCAAASKYLRVPVRPEDVQWTYSGVRPLVDDGEDAASKVTRDYLLDLEKFDDAPILTVYGGKLTTFRQLSEKAGNIVVDTLGRGGAAWTHDAFLPGGDMNYDFHAFLKTLKREYNWLPEALAYRLARAYGSTLREMLRGMKRMADLGEHLGEGVYEFEIIHLVKNEFALTLEDVVWRRSKLGLHLREDTQRNIRRLVKALRSRPEKPVDGAWEGGDDEDDTPPAEEASAAS